MNTYKVYSLKNPKDMQIVYIGCTGKPLLLRLAGHIQASFKETEKVKNRKKCEWVQELIKNNTIPVIELIEEFKDRNVAFNREKFFINWYKEKGLPLFNITNGGLGHNITHSKEVKEKLRVKAKAQWELMDPEMLKSYKERGRTRMMGNQYSKGHVESIERRQQKREAFTGKKSPTWQGFVLKLNLEGKELQRWESISAAAKEHNCTYKVLWRAIRKEKVYKEHKWAYEKQ